MPIIKEDPYTGPIDNPHISYSSESKGGKITKVIANLESYESGKYTKLGRNLKRIERLEAGIKKLKEETKAQTKEMIADLFHAEDAAHTRVVDTVSFIFHLTKNPEPTTTHQYSKILEALEQHLTPELVVMLEKLKAEFSNTVTKSPSLKATDKRVGESIVAEGVWDDIKKKVRGFMDKFTAWIKGYDAKLDKLKAMAGVNESMDEAMPLPVKQKPDLNRVYAAWAGKLADDQFQNAKLFESEDMAHMDEFRECGIHFSDSKGSPGHKNFTDAAKAQEFAFRLVSLGGEIDSVDFHFSGE